MTIFYLDPEGGNDANAGTSFALRWKTLTSGATAARIAPGDVIRLIASADPVAVGSAAWTDNSGTITWSGVTPNKVIDDCDVAWTASTNITCSTSATRRKVGTAGASITPASGFTTGKAAYRTLPATLDLSGYQQVSLWFYPGAAAIAAAGMVTLNLCSDTTGDVVVQALNFPLMSAAGWNAVVLDAGTALPNNVASLSLTFNADPSTSACYIDNIVAAKAPGASDCVTHYHVVGKNTGPEPWWYSILSLSDTGLVLGGAYNCELGSASTAPRPYRGSSETVSTSVLLGLPPWLSTERSLQDSGTEAAPILLSGGWDRTAMSTQSGVSYINGRHSYTAGINGNSKAWFAVERIGGLNIVGPTIDLTACTNIDIALEQTVGCAGSWTVGSTTAGFVKLSTTAIQGATAGLAPVHSSPDPSAFEVYLGRVHGSCVGASTGAINLVDNTRLFIDRIDNSGGYGLACALTEGQSGAVLGTTFANNGATDVRVTAGSLYLYDAVWTSDANTLGGASEEATLYSTRDQGVATAHRTMRRYFTVTADATTRHTASGLAWRINPLSTTVCHSKRPAYFPLGKIAVRADQLCTIVAWLRRDNAAIAAGLRLRSRAIPGVTDEVRSLMTAAADTWEEVTLTFTPTVDGVITLEGIAWGGTTYSAWFDDLNASQA